VWVRMGEFFAKPNGTDGTAKVYGGWLSAY
jgi:hypothetical protein